MYYNKNCGQQGKIGEVQIHTRLNISKTLDISGHTTINSTKISGFRLQPLA